MRESGLTKVHKPEGTRTRSPGNQPGALNPTPELPNMCSERYCQGSGSWDTSEPLITPLRFMAVSAFPNFSDHKTHRTS